MLCMNYKNWVKTYMIWYRLFSENEDQTLHDFFSLCNNSVYIVLSDQEVMASEYRIATIMLLLLLVYLDVY